MCWLSKPHATLRTLLSRRFDGEEQSFVDAWRDYVMPHAVGRSSGS